MTLTGWLRARPRQWLRLRIAGVAVAALAFATLAFAAHLHELNAAKGHVPDQVCGLCVHFERLGTTPDPELLPGLAPIAAAAPTGRELPAPPEPASAVYRSRAPPA